MKLIIDIDEETYNNIQSRDWKNGELVFSEEWKAIHNGTPIPDNATNGDVIMAIFGDKVFSFFHGYGLSAKLGNWFNMGTVAQFDEDWWNAPYEGSDTECR